MISLKANISYQDLPHAEWVCNVVSHRCRYTVVSDDDGYVIMGPGLRVVTDHADYSHLPNNPEAIACCLVALLETGELE